ncbi:XrtA system polysaccharide chain length determinant [Dokdonella koreensis]|uniref:Lipopolysaccharide biosynthesis n=1 Tax=Dokdonella koreensis DS-123 TaxID=1300342 RepID=A0A160DT82_9GAMM|nr:XrtA system polysaccharide chain length determinant [Dokdonella koreensis]ANB17151.1 Lipopolysaccharide biosynthesis [Dokdonella koreensis DS-123]
MNDQLPTLASLLPIMSREAWRRRVVLAITFAVIALAALVLGVIWKKKYESATTILVQETNIIQPLMEGRAVPTGVGDRAAIAREVVFGRKVMTEVLTLGGWLSDSPGPIEQERRIEDIKNATRIASPRENLIRISYTDSDPERAFKVAGSMADLFIKESLEAKERESREAYKFVDSQVQEYHAKLTDAESKLMDYRNKNPDARPGTETDVNARISELRRQTDTAQMEIMELRSREAALVSQLSGESDVSAVQTRESQYRLQLVELQANLDRLLLSYTDQHPDVIRVRHQMADLQEGIRQEQAAAERRRALGGAVAATDENAQFNPLYQELKSRLAETRRNIAAIDSRHNASSTMLTAELDRSRRIANSENVLAELTRDYEVNRDIYQDLLRRRENARVSMNLDAERRGLSFRIQEPALLPVQPIGLRFAHFGAAGIGLGLLLPLGLLFLLAQFDPRIRSAERLEQIAGVPVLASVPAYTTSRDRLRDRFRTTLMVLIVLGVAAAYALLFWLRMAKTL